MTLKILKHDFSICKLSDTAKIPSDSEFCFVGKTDEEVSLVCNTEDVPPVTLERDDGWRGFRIEGVLDFSLIGILSKISGILAENKIGLFAISTFNTDYILTKKENFDAAVDALKRGGFTIRA